jgi:hypothetical protein
MEARTATSAVAWWRAETRNIEAFILFTWIRLSALTHFEDRNPGFCLLQMVNKLKTMD